MNFPELTKILFAQVNDESSLKKIEKQLVDKNKVINELQKREEQLRKDVERGTLELYTLKSIAKEVVSRAKYQHTLEEQIEDVYTKTHKLGHLLERVEWHKIAKYDELKQQQEQRELQDRYKKMEEMNAQLEQRHIVGKLRALREKRDKLKSMLDEANITLKNMKLHGQSKIETIIEKRNKNIVDLIKGSKQLAEFRQKIALKDSAQLFEKAENNEKELSNTFTVSQTSPPLNHDKLDVLVKAPAVEEPKIIKNVPLVFGELSLKRFDKIKFNMEPVATPDTIHPIIRESVLITKQNTVNNSKPEKHVKIVTPDHTYSTSESSASNEKTNKGRKFEFIPKISSINEAFRASPPTDSDVVATKMIDMSDEEQKMTEKVTPEKQIEESRRTSVDLMDQRPEMSEPLAKMKKMSDDIDFFGSPPNRASLDDFFDMTSAEKSENSAMNNNNFNFSDMDDNFFNTNTTSKSKCDSKRDSIDDFF